VIIQTPTPPILGTGFEGSVAAAASHLFEFSGGTATDDDGDDDDGIDRVKGDTDDDDDNDNDNNNNNNNKVLPPSCTLGAPLLTRDDESTKVPGVFLVGPVPPWCRCPFLFVLCTHSVNALPLWRMPCDLWKVRPRYSSCLR